MSALAPPVQAAIVTGIVTLAVTLLGLFAEWMRRQRKTLGEVREHVANSHTTNLRDDVDKVLERLDTVLINQARHDEAIAELRRDQSYDRGRLDRHIERG